MAFTSNITMVAPTMRLLIVNGSRACQRPACVAAINRNSIASYHKPAFALAQPVTGASPLLNNRLSAHRFQKFSNSRAGLSSSGSNHAQSANQSTIADILDREIQEETSELSRHLSTDQFPGFSVETDDSDVKLTKQVGNASVTIRFTVSSSLSEWCEAPEKNQGQEEPATSLLSMPEFQVQIVRGDQTLELSCYFEELDRDEETGTPYSVDPIFCIDELVLYKGQPKESEFAVSAEFFQEDLQEALLQYLADHGIDETFAKNLVAYATSYEKKQYIDMMKRLRNFVSIK